MIIGVDLDNTIISYDDLIYDLSFKKGFIEFNTIKNKKVIRDIIRSLPNGEEEWQKIQGLIYGQLIDQARLIDGVSEFFLMCAKKKYKVFIISHKTEYANYDKTHTNLRYAALSWMEKNHFFETDRLAINKNAVYFESSREKKIERVQSCGCNFFIDDLEETFLEPSFPNHIVKILFASVKTLLPDICVCKTWEDIRFNIFGV